MGTNPNHVLLSQLNVTPSQPNQRIITNHQYRTVSIPSNYQPISSWGYVGYTILFSIPLIGLICLIIFALSDENINRRNFARSYFCTFLLAVIVVILFGSTII